MRIMAWYKHYCLGVTYTKTRFKKYFAFGIQLFWDCLNCVFMIHQRYIIIIDAFNTS